MYRALDYLGDRHISGRFGRTLLAVCLLLPLYVGVAWGLAILGFLWLFWIYLAICIGMSVLTGSLAGGIAGRGQLQPLLFVVLHAVALIVAGFWVTGAGLDFEEVGTWLWLVLAGPVHASLVRFGLYLKGYKL